jgi:hypothetical protein
MIQNQNNSRPPSFRRQDRLRLFRQTLTNSFFQRLKANLLPRIKAESGKLTYRPFEDFMSMIRRMYAVTQKNDGTLAFRYDRQIDANGWRKTSKKELSRRSKLTVHQIRTCLRLAESHGLVERRHRGKGQKKGSDLRIRLNFRILEDMLGSPKDTHKLARDKSESYNWPSAEDQSTLKTACDERALDGGNFPRLYIYNNNSTNSNKEIDINGIKKHSPDGESHFIKYTEEEEQVEEGSLVAEGSRDCIRHAYGKVLVEIDADDLLRVALSASDDDVFEIRNDEMEIVRYLQGSDMNLIGFPTKENVNSRIPVRWTPSLLKLFLKRVRQDGLTVSFFKSYFFHFQSEMEVPHICLATFGKLLAVFPKYRHCFRDRRDDDDLDTLITNATNFVDSVNGYCESQLAGDLRYTIEIIKHSLGRELEQGQTVFREALLNTYLSPEDHYYSSPNGLLFGPLFIYWKNPQLNQGHLDEVFLRLRHIVIENLEHQPDHLLGLWRLYPEFITKVFGDDWERDESIDRPRKLFEHYVRVLEKHGPYRPIKNFESRAVQL